MKIIILNLNLALESGNPRLVFSLGQAYKSLGHKVSIYTAEFDPNCFPKLNKGLDIKVVHPPRPLSSVSGSTGFFSKAYKRFKRIILYRSIARKIAEELPADAELLICQNDDSYKVGLYYKKINQHAKVVWIMYNPPFYHSHKNNFMVNIGSKIFTLWEYFTVRKYSKGIDLVVTDEEIKEQPIRNLGLPTMRMAIPVNFDIFYNAVKSGMSKNQPIVLLGIGGLSPTRRFEDIISAVAMLRKKGYDAKAVIVCKDYWRESDYRKQFELFLEESGVKQYIDARFDGAAEEELVQMFKTSDIFVFPNNVNIWGMTIFEAMAAGLPTIVSRSTSVAEFLRNGENTLLIDPLEPDQIADNIELLVNSPELYQKITKNGQELVRASFSAEKYARDLLAKASRL